MVKEIIAGSKMTSSKYPSKGMKSGIRSIGDNAYMTVIAANAFAMMGVSLCFNARKTAGMSLFNCLALPVKFMMCFL